MFLKWFELTCKREWAAGAREAGFPVTQIPKLWSQEFGEGHGFPFKELGGTNSSDVDVASIISVNCSSIARVTADTPPLLFPRLVAPSPANSLLSPMAPAPTSNDFIPPLERSFLFPSNRVQCFVRMSVDKKRQKAAGGVEKRGS
jgi:hypothetical protein